MNSEKRFLLAVAISFLILIFYPVWLKWVSPAGTQQTVSQEKVAGHTTAPAEEETLPAPQVESIEQVGTFKDNRYRLVQKYYDVEFSDRGGTITMLTLKNWGKPGAKDVQLIDVEENQRGAFLVDLPGQGIDFDRLRFSVESMDEKKGLAVFGAEIPGLWRIKKSYQFDPENPAVAVTVEAKNISNQPKSVAMGIHSQIQTEAHSRDRYYAEVFTHTPAKLFSSRLDKVEKKPKIVEGDIGWNALTRKYFAVVVKPDQPALLSKTEATEKPAQDFYNQLKLAPATVGASGSVTHSFLIFAGPQYQRYLKAYGFDSILFQGFFGIFKSWLLTSLVWTYGLVGNYGWAIIIITIVIKILFTPLTHISFESMRKMQALQPKIKALQERYKDDKARQSREMMELYRKYKVNPMAGCLPMLLQIPIFIAFYHVLAQTVELNGEPFIWWIKDLSEPDHLYMLPFSLPILGNAINLLPILMIGSMIWQQKLTPQTGPADQQKMMMLMPIVFGFIFYNLPSGLVLYWFVNNLLTIFHQLFIKGKALPHHEDDLATA